MGMQPTDNSAGGGDNCKEACFCRDRKERTRGRRNRRWGMSAANGTGINAPGVSLDPPIPVAVAARARSSGSCQGLSPTERLGDLPK
jgi:hypothetical protein